MSDYGIVTESGAVRFERLLPAPVERVWDYLVKPDLRARWFAAGDMDLRPGGAATLIFRNSSLAPAGEETPERFQPYEGMVSKAEIVRAEPPRLLVFLWLEESGPPSEVSWALEPRGQQTLFTLTHRRLATRAALIDVSSGWHLHLDVLAAILSGRPRQPFWSRQAALETEYGARMPADEPQRATGAAG